MAKGKIKDRGRVNDQWTQKAKAAGYPARSVFKLKETDDKHRLLKPGQKVLDLGCAPGSWSNYAAERVGASGLVIGVDLNEVQIQAGERLRIIQADVFELDRDFFEDEAPFDVVLSDMAPKTTGSKSVDQDRSYVLSEAAAILARDLLRPGGSLFIKIFQGPDADALVASLRSEYKTVRRVKPKSSRAFSVEIFVLATGFQNNNK